MSFKRLLIAATLLAGLSVDPKMVFAQIKVDVAVAGDTVAVTWEHRPECDDTSCRVFVRIFPSDSSHVTYFRRGDTLVAIQAQKGVHKIALAPTSLPSAFEVVAIVTYDRPIGSDGTLFHGLSIMRVTPGCTEKNPSWYQDVSRRFTITRNWTTYDGAVLDSDGTWKIPVEVHKVFCDGKKAFQFSGDALIKDRTLSLPWPLHPGRYWYQYGTSVDEIIVP